MERSTNYEQLIDVVEELFEFTLVVRDWSEYMTGRYGERKEANPVVVRMPDGQ